MESYKHSYAKNVVAQWLKPRLPRYNVHTEYPVCLNENNNLVGIPGISSWPKIPTYEDCIAKKLLPIAIFDVAAIQPGYIFTYEIVHRHGISDVKRAYLDRIGDACYLTIVTVDADWILSQCEPPRFIKNTGSHWSRPKVTRELQNALSTIPPYTREECEIALSVLD